MQPEPPPIEAVRLVNGFRVYQMVVAACELRLPDLLAAGPQDAAGMAAATDTDARSLRRLLRALTAWGVFVEEADGRFSATAISDAFRADKPGLRNLTLMLNDEGYEAWGYLLHSVRSGTSAFEKVFGRKRFDALADDPVAAARFNAAMVESTTRVAHTFVDAYDFSGVHAVVDVGGGSGALLASVLRAHPNMRGVLFDLPQGLAGARERLDADGLAGRVTMVEGSFFESLPSGGDLYMLKSIIHDWDDEPALKILKACRRAAGPASRIVLLERTLPERIDTSRQSMEVVMGDMQMLVVLGSRERTTAEYGDLLAQAGFRMTRLVPTASGLGAVEAVPD
jgi:ubiquinone/menaquinone biosynthesis C-methylase UbiE